MYLSVFFMNTANKLSADYVGASSTNTFKTELKYTLVGWNRCSEKGCTLGKPKTSLSRVNLLGGNLVKLRWRLCVTVTLFYINCTSISGYICKCI